MTSAKHEVRAAATIAGNKFSTEKEQAPRWGAATIEVADNDVQKPGTAYPTACSGVFLPRDQILTQFFSPLILFIISISLFS